MTITVYPADAVAGAPTYTGRKLRQAMASLAAGATAARPLGGFSGVRPGSGVVGSATSTTWTITPHAGQLDLQAAAQASVYLYAIDDSSNTGAVTAADSNNPRVDIVYLTLNDPAEGDGSTTPGVVPGYLAGTPATTPAAPAAPARSMVLFTIAVPKAGGGSPTVAMAAMEVGAAGSPVGVRSDAQRDALTGYKGLRALRLDADGAIDVHNGTAWRSSVWADFTPTLYSDPAGAKTPIGTTVGYARYRYVDAHTVHAQVNCARQAGATVPSLGVSLPVPAAFRSLNCGTLVVSGSSAPAGQSLRAYMSPDQTALIPTAFTNGFLAVDPLQSVSYDVTYEV